MADEEREEHDVTKKTKEGAELDKITDKEEEREMRKADTTKIKAAMQKVAEQQAVVREAQRIKDKALAAVKVSEEDIALIAHEFELSKKKAEIALREGKGDVKATIRSLISAAPAVAL